MKNKFKKSAFVVAGAVLLLSSVASAAEWIQSNATGNWSEDSNWENPATNPNGAGSIADLVTGAAVNSTTMVDVNRTVGQIRYGGGSGAELTNVWFINPASATLTFDNSGQSIGVINGQERFGALVSSNNLTSDINAVLSLGPAFAALIPANFALNDNLYIVNDTLSNLSVNNNGNGIIQVQQGFSGTNKNITVINNNGLAVSLNTINSAQGTIRFIVPVSTFTGNVFLEKGAVTFAANANAGNTFGASTNLITMGNSLNNDAVSLMATGGSGSGNVAFTLANPIKLEGTGLKILGTAANSTNALSVIRYTGNIDLNGSDLTLRKFGGQANSLVFETGVISGAGNITLFGDMTFSGSNTYSGNTTINTGVVAVNGSAIPDGPSTGNVVMANIGSVLALAGDETINGLSAAAGLGTVRPSTAANRTLTLGGNDQTSSYGGILANNSTGVLSVTKIGTGTQTLTAANTATGTVTISDGALQLGNGGTTGSVASTASIVNNASLIYNRSNAISVANPISGSGSVIQAGTGTTTLTNANTYGGTTTVSAGALLVNGSHTGGDAYNVLNSVLGGTGSVDSAVNIQGSAVLAPGSGGVGNFTVGSADIDGILEIQYNGDSDTIDKLVVTGTLDIGATVLNFINLGTATLSGGVHIFAQYGSLAGDPFSEFNIIGLPAGYSIDYDYQGDKIALVNLPGDFNGDGNVDGLDFGIWQQNFPTASNADLDDGDADGDGDVDGADFVVWQTNFPSVSASASPLPEPMSIFIAGIGCIVMWADRRRWHKQR
jgi:fibronectin-binding autotransporter adhesin